ncbi:MAG: RecX family transcriptional regulator [Acidobacteria bacterium]|nr:RecX family transcriptional regulator [Acidobacteriota bacterium]
MEPPSGEKLYESAVRALARRARSSGEVRQLLARKKATKSQIEEILHRLRENGYLDDARFARHFAATRVEGNLHGKARVRRDLAARRLKPQIADEAVKKAFEGVNETELLREYIRRKVRMSQPPTKPTAVAALHRRLLRAGFSSATIIQELKRILQSPLLKARATDAEAPSWDELLDSLSEISDTSESFG